MKKIFAVLVMFMLLCSCSINETIEKESIEGESAPESSTHNIDEPAENTSVVKENLYYPENLYEMDVEHFVNRENDEYIHYLFDTISSVCVPTFSNVSYFEDISIFSGTELSSDQLLNIFFVAFKDNYCCYWNDEQQCFLIPVLDIQTIIEKYFLEYTLNIFDTSYNFEYAENNTIIKSPGFIGLDFIFYAGYTIDSVTDNENGTVKVTILENGTEMVNDDIVSTGEISAVHTIVFKPAKDSCIICSYERNWLQNQSTIQP